MSNSHQTDSPLRVLILEDVADDAELITQELHRSGIVFMARCVHDELEFRKEMHGFTPHLVLSDYSLPHFSGMEALAIKTKLAPAIPFIMITGVMNEELAVACIKAGADDYLLKDRLARLGSAVRSAMERKRARAERQRAEQQLRKSEQRFRALIENSLEGVILLGREGRVAYASPSTQRILGYAPQDLAGRCPLDCIHADDASAAQKLAHDLLEEPGREVSGQVRFRHRDGSWRWIECIAKNLLAQPSIEAVVTNYRDVTERRDAQEFIQSSLREKEALLREIHHRVKNNLQVISSLLQLRMAEIKDLEARQLIREAQTRIRSMALVHEKLYRSDQPARVNFAEYLHGLVAALFRSYEVGSESVSFRVNAEPLLLGMDVAIPCGIVVNELVTNALKHAFAPPRRETAKIEIELLAGDSPCATLVVRDNGSGLPPCIDVTSTQSEGLALVRAMAEQLGAKMEVSTGHGTEFKLAFCVGDG